VACTYAQVQIYGPHVGPICDIDWIIKEPAFRQPNESWLDYTGRVNSEIGNWFREIWPTTDWRKLVLEVGALSPYPAAIASGAEPRGWVLLEMFFATEDGALNTSSVSR
jgi:hypothetical protein